MQHLDAIRSHLKTTEKSEAECARFTDAAATLRRAQYAAWGSGHTSEMLEPYMPTDDPGCDCNHEGCER